MYFRRFTQTAPPTKDKAVIQYLSLFSLVDLLELCQEIGNSIDGYPSLYADMKKELGRKR